MNGCKLGYREENNYCKLFQCPCMGERCRNYGEFSIADWIRTLNDEDLAKWLLSSADLCGQCDTHSFCTGCPDDRDQRCVDAVIKYLRQPAKEVDNG